MQHDSFLWWVTVCILAIMGANIGKLCARAADHYDGLMRAGSCPDGISLGKAICAAMTRARAPIICADGAQWSATLVVLSGTAGAVMLAGLYLRYGSTPAFATLAFASVLLGLLACIDARTFLLPDALTQPLLWAGLLGSWFGIGISVEASVAGVMLGYGIPAGFRFLWLWWRQVEGMGAGDIKLLAALGAWVGARSIIIVLLAACIGGLLFAMAHQRSLSPRGAYPFGPFIAISGMAAFLLKSAVQSWF